MFFGKKTLQIFVSSVKSRIFAASKTRDVFDKEILGYGVMVTLQILVLSFQVRILVAQLLRERFA